MLLNSRRRIRKLKRRQEAACQEGMSGQQYQTPREVPGGRDPGRGTRILQIEIR